MGLDDRPPHPGPTPEPFEFPFAEATTARDRVRDLADELRSAQRVHDTARGGLDSAAFSGRAADRFRSRFDQRMDELGDRITALESDADTIDEHIAQARARAAAAESALDDWQRRQSAWSSWTPPQPASATG